MENNTEEESNQKEDQQNYDNGENGEEALDNMNMNYEGEYDGEEEQNIINQEEEGQGEEMEEGQEEDMYEGGEEEAMVEGQEEGMEEGQDVGEEAYEEQNEENQKENEEENEKNYSPNKKEDMNKNDTDEKQNNLENNENNNQFQIENNKNISNKKNINNKKRIELIKNKLNWAQNSKNNQENIIDKDVEEDNNDKTNNYKNYNFNKRDDILSELLGKIQDFKYKKKNNNIKLNSNNNLDTLDKELAKGLQNLNKKNTNINKININEEQKMNRPPKYEGEILRNPKFKEIISLINEKESIRNRNFKHIGKTDLLSLIYNKNKNNFSNINLYSPKLNKYSTNSLENRSFGNIVKKYGNDNNKYYISCIDGKAIVNGMRKDIPFISKFNLNNDKLINNNNSNYLFGDLSKTYNTNLNNIGKSSRRNNSSYMNKFFKNNEFNYEPYKTLKKTSIITGTNDFNYNQLKNNFSKENLTNKLNKMNDNYFTRELKFFK